MAKSGFVPQTDDQNEGVEQSVSKNNGEEEKKQEVASDIKESKQPGGDKDTVAPEFETVTKDEVLAMEKASQVEYVILTAIIIGCRLIDERA